MSKTNYPIVSLTGEPVQQLLVVLHYITELVLLDVVDVGTAKEARLCSPVQLVTSLDVAAVESALPEPILGIRALVAIIPGDDNLIIKILCVTIRSNMHYRYCCT